MATILQKPTSPGKRFTVSVKTEGLHKGKPYSNFLRKSLKQVEETIVVKSQLDMLVVDTSKNIELLISREINTMF